MSTSFKRVLAVGCFDGLHYGHIIHLRHAATMGQFLIVALTEDLYVNKGPKRPVFSYTQRAATLEALKYVGAVIPHQNIRDTLRIICPDVYVKGPDYKGKIDKEEMAFCRELGIIVKFTAGPKYSSRAIFKPRGVGDGDIGVE